MTSTLFIQLLITFGVGYLLGSIPFGLLLTRAAGLGDVRQIGSGNIGATNVLRTGNKKVAAATLLLDGLKGTAAIALTGMVVAPWLLSIGLGGDVPGSMSARSPANPNLAAVLKRLQLLEVLVMVAGLGAFIGHVYPVWLGFKGGKGVATYIGVLLGLAPKLALGFCAIWLIIAAATRYSSLSALLAAAIAPFAAYWLTGQSQLAILLALMSLLLFWTHRENIARLLKGTESKIGAKAKPTTDAPA
ncbi:MAG: glycerol-3-phosphate 1-O-acyltransferase PlsY [Hyphomicrobiaceae bacterium]